MLANLLCEQVIILVSLTQRGMDIYWGMQTVMLAKYDLPLREEERERFGIVRKLENIIRL